MGEGFTQHYKIKKHLNGYSFIFYCDLCNKKYETIIINQNSLQDTIDLAQKTAKQYFNKCHKCGKWICDEHYDENLMLCTLCSLLIEGKSTG
ncbi:MAG: hypothetical protein WBI07_19415 [Mobilitalea sp.]